MTNETGTENVRNEDGKGVSRRFCTKYKKEDGNRTLAIRKMVMNV